MNLMPDSLKLTLNAPKIESSPTSGSPLSMMASTSPPSTALTMRPRPPNRLVPPITAAPTATSRKSFPPVWGSTELSREASRTPATPESTAHITKADIRMRATLIPARRAASALPPTAYRWRPQAVRVSRNVRVTTRISTTSTTQGTPLIEMFALGERFRLNSRVGMPHSTASPPVRSAMTATGAVDTPLRRRALALTKLANAKPPTTRANNTHESGTLMFLLSSATISLSVTRTVPLSFVISSTTPCHIRKLANVTTKDGIPIFETSQPVNSPITSVARMPSNSASGSDQPAFRRVATTAAHTPALKPAARSISPSSRTKLTATAMAMIGPACCSRLPKL